MKRWTVIILLTIFLTGCRQETQGDEPIQKVQEETAQEQKPAEAAEPADLLTSVKEYTESSSVRILTDKVTGSGVIVVLDSRKTIVLTAAHVLDGAEEITLEFPCGVVFGTGDSKEKKGMSKVLSSLTDSGILVLETGQLPAEVTKECQQAAVDRTCCDTLVAGDKLVVTGYGMQERQAFEGSLADNWIYMEDYGQYMMMVSAKAEPGMSGGGVFDSHGHLVGILSGMDEDGNLAVVSIGLILEETEDEIR